MSSYFGYGASKDTVYRVSLRPNPVCADSWCRKRQQERRVQLVTRGLPEDAEWNAEALIAARAEVARQEREADSKPLHEENEFQIELIDEKEAAMKEEAPLGGDVDAGLSLEELMKQLGGL